MSRGLFKFEKPVKLRTKTRFGYRKKRKAYRIFNDREYLRIGQFKIKSIAETIKNNYHKKGYYSLIVKSGPNYQIWISKEKRIDVL